MRKLLIAALAALAPLCAETIVIRNATIMTVTHGKVKGSVVVKDGKIADVGEKVMEPPGATIIDAGGQYVIPGIIDCHSHIGGRWRHQRRQRLGLLDGEHQGHRSTPRTSRSIARWRAA